PTSPFVPAAYLAFGDMFFDEAMTGDASRYAFATSAYEKVVQFPPPGNVLYGYAQYKLAHVQARLREYARSLAAFRKALEFAATFAQLPEAAQLGDSVRHEIGQVYALVGDPRQAFAFFDSLAGMTEQEAIVRTSAVGRAYLASVHYADAVVIFRDLRARDA